MSPNICRQPAAAAAQAAIARVWSELGERIRDARRRRTWSTARLAAEAGVSRTSVYMAERGEASSIDVVVRLLTALGLRLDVDAVDPRRRSGATKRSEDPVHAAMGELEVGHLRTRGHQTLVDEPYQHYQFSGRADVVAWDLGTAALLHIENRTQFPNYQEAAGSFNAKKAYLATDLAARLALPRVRSVTHVMVCLWSAEILHALRLRRDTFRSLAPDAPDAFQAWWDGRLPVAAKTSSALIVLDPFATGRERAWIDLETALGDIRPRYRDYADAASRIRRGTA
jgi:transcriptional regulator with XRE-family HTH domain